jgi:hypothetical protein
MSTLPHRRSRLLGLACALLWSAAGCDCGGEGTKIAKCLSDAECSTDGSKFCDTRNPPIPEADERGCAPAIRGCVTEADGLAHEGMCCPGQICSSQAGICFDKFVQCADDDTCASAVRGQVCRPLGDSQDKGCTFEACGEVDPETGKGTCPEGTSCFNGYCVGEPPCKGGCAAGSVCTPVNNRCFVIDDPTAPYPESCQQSCRPGTVLVFADGKNVFNRCDRRVRECACEALPPVRANDLARHSSAGVAGDRIYVSAYDGDHGDLVVHEFDKATLALKTTQWVDGVPSGSGTVVGDPDGPRRGLAAPGPDVGTYTSLAHDPAGNVTHVAYYAATRDANTPTGDLKYAYRQGTGAWAASAVEEAGDVGLYTSLALSSDGFPVIAYFQRTGAGADVLKTAVKLARAKVRTPAGPSDWTITTIQSGTRSPPPCASPACTQDEVCTEGGANGTCRAKAPSANDCKTPCGSDEACVLVNNVATCKASLRAETLASLPEGNGLFPSVAYLDDKPVVVWYDRSLGVLKGAIAASDSASGGATFTPASVRVLDDGDMPGAPAGAPKHDVGQFASLAVAPAAVAKRIAVAYFDTTSRQLRLVTAKAGWAELTEPAARIVDDGKGTPELDPTVFAGADTSVRFDAGGKVQVAYQDSTRNDLRLAVEQNTGFKLETLARDGAGGFYANLLVDGANRYATHAVIRARSPSESANRLELLKIQTP